MATSTSRSARLALAAALALLVSSPWQATPALAASIADTAAGPLPPEAAALPDLRVASISISPSTVQAGKSVALTVTVYNLGAATAPAAAVHALLSLDAGISPSDRTLSQIATTPTLQRGYGVRVTRTVTLPPDAAGPAFLGVYADVPNAVAESNETNNGGSTGIVINLGSSPPPPPVATPSPTPSPTPTPPATTPPGNFAQVEQQVLARINEVRAQHNLPAVAANSLITNAARRHSNDMAANNVMSHTGSDGSSMSQRISDAGYRWSMAGEIVAAGYADPQSVVNGWMNSPGHRNIILTAGYREFGAGVARSASGRLYWTVDFASPR